jgi:hypothetical protein
VKDEAMKAIFHKTKGQDACKCCEYKSEKVKCLPGRDPVKEIGHHSARDVGNVVPFIVG